jgi:TatD DNase family protein
MDSKNPFIDTHTHKIKAGSHIAVINILVKQYFTEYQYLISKNDSNPQILFSAGIHPWYMDGWQLQADHLKKIASKSRVVAIGECGLDKNAKSPLNEQIELFQWQINLSETLQKPLIIHCIKAFNELIEIRKNTGSDMPWIVHGFNSSPEVAGQCLSSGMILSFGQSLLHPKSHSREVIKTVENNSYLLETDESSYPIEEIYHQCATIKGVNIEQLKSELANNFYNLFKY